MTVTSSLTHASRLALRRALRRALHCERGQALAEFALVMPLLLFLVIGIIEFGRAWNEQQALTDAAREAARLSVVQNSAISQDSVRTRVAAALSRNGMNSSTVTVTFTGNWRVTGDPMTVSLSTPYDFVFLAPIINVFGGSQASRITLATASTMRNE